MVVAGAAACGSFDSADSPAASGDASTEAQSDGAVGDGLALDGAAARDAGDPGCRGAFQPPRTISTVDSGIGGSLRSVRGVANGTFLISYDTSPDDDMATANLPATGLALLSTDALSALNTPSDETSPTAPNDLKFVVFVSTRSPVPDGGTGLWISEFSGAGFGAPAALSVGGIDAAAVTQINNPYLVDKRLFFDVDGNLQSGELIRLTKRVQAVVSIPGLGNGTHPVVTTDEKEIFFAVGAGIQRATRPSGAAFMEQGIIDGTLGDFPTWVSDDSCQLYAIHDTGSGYELRVFDRAP